MTGKIYLLNADSALIPMAESAYDSEALLQNLLSQHPDLLAGDQINADEPRRWLLVTPEMYVPDEEAGSQRWALDHLFLDQDAIPTLIEVKRSSDTRIRREVVGQMLDYAANAVAYWPVEEIRAKFEARCQQQGEDSDEVLDLFLNTNHDSSEFWQSVKTNLQAGRVRLVFVADVIPSELRRVVEFLNEQMDPAEVLAIEVKQFVGEGVTTLVPRVLGQTETARQKKGSTGTARKGISANEYLASVDEDHGSPEAQAFRRILAWAREQGLEDNFTTGGKGAAYIPILRIGPKVLYPFSLQRKGVIVLQMRWLKNHPPFDDASTREELEKMLCDIPGFRVADVGMEGYPKVPVTSLTDDAMMNKLLAALDWMINKLKNA